MPSVISTDVLIVGAGVAGLWLNARLRRQGFSTVLVESASLGGGHCCDADDGEKRRGDEDVHDCSPVMTTESYDFRYFCERPISASIESRYETAGKRCIP